ncbi:ferritin-like domain-containing protein [Helicobacter fennelliae]|uniref:ferritin-like domain-containing protein n=1 Tax=Helicobacter fennelliae TaxID=215 RepID=UPI000E03BADD|nr:DUF455 family protein [Helicobacter fennelliae]STQ84069.1 Uncharacterized protein conserved in bacteria [Helicobacter fennelliae]
MSQKEFFATLEPILFSKDFTHKATLLNDIYQSLQSGDCIFDHMHINTKDFFTFTPSVALHPTRIHRPKHAKSGIALAKILHSIAHIEYCAITLALDSAYRFKHLPLRYYIDWIEVAKEEIEHFLLLESLLNEIGFKYGDFAVHLGLYDAMKRTHSSLKYRMGVVHRGLEARGLDANPFVLQKLSLTPHPLTSKINEVFGIILRDEITHVSKGDHWWRFAKEANDDFLDLCKQFQDFSLAGKTLNSNARLQCGFDASEIKSIDNFYNARI